MLPVEFNINYEDFSVDPYPVLSKLRNTAPISFVPQLNAILISKHADIFICEKNISVFVALEALRVFIVREKKNKSKLFLD